MESRKMVVIVVLMLMVGNLTVESEAFSIYCFGDCLDLCILNPYGRDNYCFKNCLSECGKQSQVDCVYRHCASVVDLSKFFAKIINFYLHIKLYFRSPTFNMIMFIYDTQYYDSTNSNFYIFCCCCCVL